MKSALLTVAALVASASCAAAEITVIEPWANTTWRSGGTGTITWKTTSAEANLKCDIQLMNGNASNSNMVASVTSPQTPVDCSSLAYKIYPLNDFASGDYWIRIGQMANNVWAYSGVFKFVGNGTARPYSLASGASTVPISAASGKPTSTTKTNSTLASQSAGDEGAAVQLSAQGKTLLTAFGSALVAALVLAY